VHGDDEVVGVDDPEGARDLLRRGLEHVDPSPAVVVKDMRLNGVPLVVTQVVGGNPPYLGPGGAVVRRGPDGRQVAFSGQQFRQLFATRSAPVESDAVFSLLDALNHRLVDVQADLAAERQLAARLRTPSALWRERLASGLVGAVLGVIASGAFAAILG
jgi:hypothetical protein